MKPRDKQLCSMPGAAIELWKYNNNFGYLENSAQLLPKE